MSEDTNHLAGEEFEKLHLTNKKGIEDGACLSGRCTPLYDAITCSYRYQGREAARSYLDIYNHQDIAPSAYLDNETGQDAPRIVAAFNKKNNRRNIAINGKMRIEIVDDKGNRIGTEMLDIMKDIVRDGKGRPITWRKGVPTTIDRETKEERPYKSFNDDEVKVEYKKFWFLNFTISSVPWSNQVHHVLNHSSLYKAISAFKNIPDVVAKGLLQELYNINYKNNAIILPTKVKDTRKTGLPTHGSHPKYSEKILSKVKDALIDYEGINENYDPTHEKPEPIDVKQQLIKISDTWYKKIIDTVPQNKKKKRSESVIKINDIK